MTEISPPPMPPDPMDGAGRAGRVEAVVDPSAEGGEVQGIELTTPGMVTTRHTMARELGVEMHPMMTVLFPMKIMITAPSLMVMMTTLMSPGQIFYPATKHFIKAILVWTSGGFS